MTLFFFSFALVIAGITVIILVLPLTKKHSSPAATPTSAFEAEKALYHAQVADLEADVASGTIDVEQAKILWLEIRRRFLAVTQKTKLAPQHPLPRKALILVLALLIPASSLGLYTMLGQAGMPDFPYRVVLAKRISKTPAEADIQYAELQALMQSLQAAPADSTLWRKAADLNRSLMRFDSAAAAYRNALQRGDLSLDTLVSFAEMLVWSDKNSQISDEARTAFELALKTDPKDLRSRYYLAQALAEDNKLQEAIVLWENLSTDLPPNSPISNRVQENIQQARLLTGNATGTGTGTAPALSPDQTDAVTPEMIEGMVASLATRLEENPNDLTGWVMLGRSYTVLKRPQEALIALKRALELAPDQSLEHVQIKAMIEELEKGTRLPSTSGR